jgi:galactose-1-phosphate uridylyltransferase
MNDCLFCKIIAGQIPGRFVHEDHEIVAIRDINPQAPLHVLIIPRRHIATLNDLDPHDDALVGALAYEYCLTGNILDAAKLGLAAAHFNLSTYGVPEIDGGKVRDLVQYVQVQRLRESN